MVEALAARKKTREKVWEVIVEKMEWVVTFQVLQNQKQNVVK